MRRRRLPTPARWAAAVASALVAMTGLTMAPTHAAPGSACPAVHPVADLDPGDPVTGLTVTSGVTPGAFSGEVLGVLEDALAPGRDLIMADLHSPTIDKVGIWQGMSGSPVYAEDGRLIGAVAFGLSFGPSTVAGLTPAADMRRLLTGAQVPGSKRRRVAVPDNLAARVATAGAATKAEAKQGMRRLPLPIGMSGLTAARLKELAPLLGFRGAQLSETPIGRASSERIDVPVGGNLAATISYGAVTAAALGTATMVCGSEVVGFGHPFLYTGPSTLTMHGARAVHIQDDPAGPGFKLGNTGAPIGTVDADRSAGLHAMKGALPGATTVSSKAADGSSTFSGVSRVTVPEFVGELASTNMIAISDLALDRTGKGTATAGWTIKGLRKNGRPFSFARSDMYADPFDISLGVAFAMAEDLTAIQDNPDEAVKITSVTTATRFGIPYEVYAVSRVQVLRSGAWISSAPDKPLPLRAGKVARLKVILTSREGRDRALEVRVWVPARAKGRLGTLSIVGGNEGAGSAEESFEEDPFEGSSFSPSALPKLLKQLGAGPKHNEVVATVRFRGGPSGAVPPRRAKASLNRVVGGSITTPVRVTREP